MSGGDKEKISEKYPKVLYGLDFFHLTFPLAELRPKYKVDNGTNV